MIQRQTTTSGNRTLYTMKSLTKVNPERCPIVARLLDALLIYAKKENGADHCVLNGLCFMRQPDGIYHAALRDDSPVPQYENSWTDAEFGFGPRPVSPDAMAAVQQTDPALASYLAPIAAAVQPETQPIYTQELDAIAHLFESIPSQVLKATGFDLAQPVSENVARFVRFVSGKHTELVCAARDFIGEYPDLGEVDHDDEDRAKLDRIRAAVDAAAPTIDDADEFDPPTLDALRDALDGSARTEVLRALQRAEAQLSVRYRRGALHMVDASLGDDLSAVRYAISKLGGAS